MTACSASPRYAMAFAEGTIQRAVVRPQLLDRENCCRKKQRSAPNRATVSFTIGPITSSRQAWTKVPSPESLTFDVAALRQRGHAVAPELPARRRHVFQHAGVFEHEHRIRETRAPTPRHQPSGLRISAVSNSRPWIGKAAPVRGANRRSFMTSGARREAILRIFVPMQLLANPARRRQISQTL